MLPPHMLGHFWRSGDAGAAVGVVASSLLARTGAVRMSRHAAIAALHAPDVSQHYSSAKRRSMGGNGGGNGNGGSIPDEEAQDGLKGLQQQSLHQQEVQQQQAFVLPFKAFCIGFSIGTLVLTALAVGKQNIPALQKPLAPGASPSFPFVSRWRRFRSMPRGRTCMRSTAVAC